MTLTHLLTAPGSTRGNHTKNRQQSSQHKPLLLTTALFVSLILYTYYRTRITETTQVEQSLFPWQSKDEWRKNVGSGRLSTLGINASNFVNVLTMLVVPTGTVSSPLKSLCYLSSKFLFSNKRTKKKEGTGSTRVHLEWAVKQRWGGMYCSFSVTLQCFEAVSWSTIGHLSGP